MILSFVALCTCVIFAPAIRAHQDVKTALGGVKDDVQDIKQEQKDIEEVIRSLSDSFKSELKEEEEESESAESEPVGISAQIGVSKRKAWLERLDAVERNIILLNNYIGGERENDKFLSRLPGDLMDGFKGKMKQTNELVQKMKGNVKESLKGVKSTLNEVETSAKSRNVEVAGVMYYGGIGSACGVEYMECRVEASECRSGICQCEAGLSYDGMTQECVESCSLYGDTYQIVDKHIIRGYNNHTMENVTLSECKTRCQEERKFECRSFDYFPRWKTCFLSEFVVGDVPEESWEHNEAGYHFQRDCLF